MIIRLQVVAIAILIFLSGCTKTNESPTEAISRLSKLDQDREIQRLNREKIEQKREQDERLAREKEDSISLRTALTPLIKSRKQRISLARFKWSQQFGTCFLNIKRKKGKNK